MKDPTNPGDFEGPPTETYRGPRRFKKPSPSLRRGDSLGRYVVVDKIGAGGMGVVYAAYDPELNRRVAIKVLSSDSESSPDGEEARLRLLREAQALARVVHQNVVTIHDVGSVGRRVFLAMEYVDGEDLPAALHSIQEGDPAETWRQVLALFLEAGRGLAAVHAAGLAHRDFKPSNVRVGADGRVRILDFGLALSAATDEDKKPPPEPSAESTPGGEAAPSPDQDSALLDSPLTRDGQIFGTPRYMAPEQHLGQRADALSDQFSFCVALFEVLYGQRPFPASSAQEMLRLTRRGLPDSAPEGSKLPAVLYDTVVRGLAFDPSERHGDLGSLLADLEKITLVEARRWRGRLLLAVCSLLVVAAAWRLGGTPPCQGAEAKLLGVWDDGRRGAAAAAMGDPAAWAAAASVLDRYAKAWTLAHRDACEATHVRQEQSPELLDLRMACLEDRRQELRALTGLFLDPTPELIADAGSAASKLSPLAPCADTELLLAPLTPPQDTESAARLKELRKELSTSRARRAASRQGEALLALEPVLEAADTLAYPPITAEARLHQADLLYDLGQYGEAAKSYRAAMVSADEGRHDDVRARALIGLVWAEKSRNRPRVAADWSEQARAAIRRAGDQPDLLMRWYQSAAQVALTRWDGKTALRWANEAFELSRQVHGERHLHTGQYLAAVASALSIDFRFEEALEVAERSADIQREILGADHPNIGRVESNMALQEIMLGRIEAARAHLAGSLEKAHSMRDDHLVSVYRDLGWTEARLGDRDEAARHLEAARALAIELHGEESPRVAEIHNYFADAYLELGEADLAEEHSVKALEILHASPPGAVERVAPSLNLALAQARDARWTEAEASLDKIRDHIAGDAFWRWVIERIDGLVSIGKGRAAEAVTHLQSALAFLEGSPAASPLDIHALRLDVARALRAAGREEEAREEARQALDFFTTQGRAGTAGAETCRAFLAKEMAR